MNNVPTMLVYLYILLQSAGETRIFGSFGAAIGRRLLSQKQYNKLFQQYKIIYSLLFMFVSFLFTVLICVQKTH
jgi:preprotein translocase subunit SecG